MLDMPAPDDTRLITLDRVGDVCAVIDAHLYWLLTDYRWELHHCGKGKYYARSRKMRNGKREYVYMHRLIAQRVHGPAPGARQVVDHINGDSLDNRSCNLRWMDAWANRWHWQHESA